MIEEPGGRALAVRCDVSRAEDVKAALDKTVETFGRLDFAFNNAGVEQPLTPTADLTEEEWDRIVDINLRGVFLCMKHEIPLMLKQGGGAIVNTSSGAGVIGIAGQSRVLRREMRRDRPHEGGGPRLREIEHPRERRVSRGSSTLPMMDRFTGRHARGAAEGDRGGAGRAAGQPRRRSPRPSSGCARTRPPSSSGTPWSSMAARRCSDVHGPAGAPAPERMKPEGTRCARLRKSDDRSAPVRRE